MKIGGFQRFSLLDYPGKISCIVFTQGCNFRCPYCYNAELVLPERFKEPIQEEEVINFLKSRSGKLEGVVITGGEPTIQADLPQFLWKVKDMGFLVKLDTNGYMPDVLEMLLLEGLVDYVAMDVKAPLDKYVQVVGANIDTERISESIKIIMKHAREYEFRTTVVRNLVGEEELLQIANLLKGAKRFYIQNFSKRETVDPSFSDKQPFTREELSRMLHKICCYFEDRDIR